MSKATACGASIFSCTKHAVEGACLSGVEVATIIRSISFGVISVLSKAFNPALYAKSLVTSPSAILRSRIPRFLKIHSSDEPTFSKKSFFKIFGGTY